MAPDQDGLVPPRRSGNRDLTRAATGAPIPPHPLDKRWYLSVDGQTYGPYSGHELRNMVDTEQFQENDYVCPEGGDAWIAAKSDPLLGSVFKRRSSQVQFHAPAPVAGNSGTVVQITNQMPNNNAAAALLLATGDAAPKSPGIALLLSFFICGAGQMYNGQVGKGIAMLIAYWFTAVMMFSLLIVGGFVLGLILFVLWLWSIIDAYSTAKTMTLRYQQRVLAGLT
jgi:TM2 domain-containing membrane protein YozV